MEKYKILVYMVGVILILVLFGFLFVRDFSSYVFVSDQKSLSDNRNEYAFNNDNYEKYSDDYLIVQAEYIAPYINYILDDNSNVIDVGKISSDKLMFVLNILLSGASEDICYEKEFLNEKFFDVFGRKNGNFSVNSHYYNYSQDKICFDVLFLNGESKAKASNIFSKDDFIYVNVRENEYRRWQIVYKKHGDKIFLNKFILS